MEGGEGASPGSPLLLHPYPPLHAHPHSPLPPQPSPLPHPPPHSTAAVAVSIVVPILNERELLPCLLRNLEGLSGLGELVFVDGGSHDGSVEWLRSRGVCVLESIRGRGQQLARGAAAATGDILWFLHADSQAPSHALSSIRLAVAAGSVAGACQLRFAGSERSARWMTWFYARMRRVGLVYGDSGMYITREAYLRAGGFPAWPLFEDLGLLRRLRQAGAPRMDCLDVTLTTSSRRFEGWRFPLVFAQWVALQTLFWLGAPVPLLATLYRWPKRTR